MAGLQEQALWDAEIYQIEQTDPVVGGPPNLAQGQGITNVPHQALANRTAWLKAQIEALGQTLTDLTNGAPGALDTLNELAAALGDDPNFAATITAGLGGKVNSSEFQASLLGAGFQKLPSGLIVQWNTVLSSAGGSQFTAFPITYPNSELRTVLSPWVSATSTNATAIINSVAASGVNWTGFLGSAGTHFAKATTGNVRVSILSLGH